jgi:hypothetical protein
MNTFKETMLSSILFESSGSKDTTMTSFVLLVTMCVVLIAILISLTLSIAF